MSDFTFRCPSCRGKVGADTVQAGQAFICPECNRSIVVPHPQKGTELLLVGWILFAVGMLMICLMPFCLLLFFGAIVLGALAIALSKRIGEGIALIICSTVVPLLSILLIPLLVAGSFLTALGLSLPDSSPKPPVLPKPVPVVAPAQVKPTIDVPPSTAEVEQAPIAVFLNRMEIYSKAYRAAQTTVQRDEINKKAIEMAPELLADIPKMTLTATIKDVKNPSDDKTIVTFGDYDLGGFKIESGKTLYVGCWGQMIIEMKRSKALSITPGSTFEITGTPVFETSTMAMHGTPTVDSQRIMIIGHGGFPSHLFGALMMKYPKWRILVKQPKKHTGS